MKGTRKAIWCRDTILHDATFLYEPSFCKDVTCRLCIIRQVQSVAHTCSYMTSWHLVFVRDLVLQTTSGFVRVQLLWRSRQAIIYTIMYCLYSMSHNWTSNTISTVLTLIYSPVATRQIYRRNPQRSATRLNI